MTRRHSIDAAGVIEGGSASINVFADVYYGNTRTMQDVPLQDWSFTGDYDGKIKTAGSVTIAYQGEFADSVSPAELTDKLAPFGQEVRPYCMVGAGVFAERIELGVYRIESVPSADDTMMLFGERPITVGSLVELELLDRFYALDVPTMKLEKPTSLTSAWAEIARLSGQVVTRTVDDVTIPRSIVYARNRLEAVQQLAALMGGRAMMRSDGTIGVVPDEIGSASVNLYIGEDRGKIIDVGRSMTSEGVANAVYGDFETEEGREIHVEARQVRGPLSVHGPFGERPVEYPNDQKEFIRTREAAQTAVENLLAKVLQQGPREVPVEITPDPRIEVGDIVTLERQDVTLTGRVISYTFAKDAAQSLTVRIP